MKLQFDWSYDDKYHQYCMYCHAETVEREYVDDKTYYRCSTCRQQHERSIVIDPAIKWWVADDGEYWHESAGVFVINGDGRFLFFERTIFPFALTVPSGHVDTGEEAEAAARRELAEEVGLDGIPLRFIATADIDGDSCRRGADVHRWHAYVAEVPGHPNVEVKEEGGRPVWLTLDEVAEKDLVFPVKYVINEFRNELEYRRV